MNEWIIRESSNEVTGQTIVWPLPSIRVMISFHSIFVRVVLIYSICIQPRHFEMEHGAVHAQ
jgi:hypothetical protein